LTPLDYMLTVMRDANSAAERRDERVKAAAPCVHPRLAAINHSGRVDLGVAERLAAAIARVGNPDGECRKEADLISGHGDKLPSVGLELDRRGLDRSVGIVVTTRPTHRARAAAR
jgi:hypothetical protein